MQNLQRLLLPLLAVLALGFDYPPARKGDTVDDYHGTRVADPYRWLEDADSPETRAWIDAENKLTFGWLEKLPQRAQFKKRLTEVQDFERFGVPRKEYGRYFFTRNSGLQNQNVLYTVDKLDGEPRVLLDPNTLLADGTAAIKDYSFTPDARLMVYALSMAGSDWQEWRVRDVATGKDLPDVVSWAKFADAAWSHDGKGFYYSTYARPAAGTELTATNYFQKMYYHRLGTPQAKDEVILERKDQKEWGFQPTVSDDGRYLVASVWKGSDPNQIVWIKDVSKKRARWIELQPRFESRTSFLGNSGTTIFLFTDKGAPRGRVVSVDLASKERAWTTVIPEDQSTVEEVTMAGQNLIVRYLDDAASRVTVFGLDGKKVRDVALPGLGTASGFKGRMGENEIFFSYESFSMPPTIYRHDLAAGTTTVFRQPKLAFDPAAFETRRIFVTAKDGTKLPLFLTGRKGTTSGGDRPTILYGYGGFDNSMSPTFKIFTLAWVEAGGIFAHAVLRGDGPYGREFHEAGMLDRKQNVFDDFIADAELLIKEKITSTPKLAIYGGSNGGLLVGAVLNQRPELFGCALPSVGVMDMLRYHKFTIGWSWAPEYGSSDDAKQFATLFKYSPLHNIKPGTKVPPTFITTADHDDRVVPAHSFKYAAAMQAAQGGPAPILIRIETRAGHSAGKPTSKIIEESADRLAFTAAALGLK